MGQGAKEIFFRRNCPVNLHPINMNAASFQRKEKLSYRYSYRSLPRKETKNIDEGVQRTIQSPSTDTQLSYYSDFAE